LILLGHELHFIFASLVGVFNIYQLSLVIHDRSK
jgi:hypothetical protein